MKKDDSFDLSAKARALADEILERKAKKLEKGATAPAAPTQVLFYDEEAREFAFAWEENSQTNDRWIFPVQPPEPDPDPSPVYFVYYVCRRLQWIGSQAGQVLFATAGQGALFYATVASEMPDSPGIVGLLPRDTQPDDFGTTLHTFAPQATLTLATSSTAGDQDFEGTFYKGTELVGQLAGYLGGKTVASDQAIVWNADGTASTTGNVWLGDPSTFAASILCPAPGDGISQNFPLAPNPVCS